MEACGNNEWEDTSKKISSPENTKKRGRERPKKDWGSAVPNNKKMRMTI